MVKVSQSKVELIEYLQNFEREKNLSCVKIAVCWVFKLKTKFI